MKITDQELLRKIFLTTAQHLPYKATYNCIGGERGLGSTDEWSHEYATWICTARREKAINTGLSNTQSMSRIVRLIDTGELVSEKRRLAQAFNFKLPDEITKPMFARTHELLIEKGITKDPSSAAGFDEIAKSITETLIYEFGDSKRSA